jgi:hypothetical protein
VAINTKTVPLFLVIIKKTGQKHQDDIRDVMMVIFSCMPDCLWIKSARKTGESGGAIWYHLIPRCFFVPSAIPLQDKCHDGDNDEDNYQPPRDFHGKSCYALCTQYIGDQCQDQENYCKIN